VNIYRKYGVQKVCYKKYSFQNTPQTSSGTFPYYVLVVFKMFIQKQTFYLTLFVFLLKN